MMLSEEQTRMIWSNSSLRNGELAWKYRWPNAIVPYQLNNIYTERQNNLIEYVLRTIESESCITFVPWANHTDYIEITVITSVI